MRAAAAAGRGRRAVRWCVWEDAPAGTRLVAVEDLRHRGLVLTDVLDTPDPAPYAPGPDPYAPRARYAPGRAPYPADAGLVRLARGGRTAAVAEVLTAEVDDPARGDRPRCADVLSGTVPRRLRCALREARLLRERAPGCSLVVLPLAGGRRLLVDRTGTFVLDLARHRTALVHGPGGDGLLGCCLLGWLVRGRGLAELTAVTPLGTGPAPPADGGIPPDAGPDRRSAVTGAPRRRGSLRGTAGRPPGQERPAPPGVP